MIMIIFSKSPSHLKVHFKYLKWVLLDSIIDIGTSSDECILHPGLACCQGDTCSHAISSDIIIWFPFQTTTNKQSQNDKFSVKYIDILTEITQKE